MEFIREHQLTLNSLPHEWFNAFCPRSRPLHKIGFHIGNWATYTKLKASLSNTGFGGTCYREYNNFLVDELMSNIVIYMINGVNPSPRTEMKISLQLTEPINGNDLIYGKTRS